MLREAKGHVDWRFVFLFRNGGTMLKAFQEEGSVIIISEEKKKRRSILESINAYILTKLHGNTNSREHKILNRIRLIYKPDLILSNTVTNYEILKIAKEEFSIPVVTYVHEGDRLLTINNFEAGVTYSLNASNSLIAVSRLVQTILESKFDQKNKVTYIPGATPTVNSQKYGSQQTVLPKGGRKMILACGYPNWHKGTDLFLHVASKVIESRKDVIFVWLGGNEADVGFGELKYDIEKKGLQGSVFLIPNQDNPESYIEQCELLLITSRDESFSLVTIEAGIRSKAILCFERSGGPCEIVNNDLRFIVSYANIDEMAARVLSLLDNDAERSSMQRYLSVRVTENYTLEKTVKPFIRVIENAILMN